MLFCLKKEAEPASENSCLKNETMDKVQKKRRLCQRIIQLCQVLLRWIFVSNISALRQSRRTYVLWRLSVKNFFHCVSYIVRRAIQADKFLLPLFATVAELHTVSKSPCVPLLLTQKDGRGNHTGDRTAMAADINVLSNAAMSLHISNQHRNVSTLEIISTSKLKYVFILSSNTLSDGTNK